MNRGFTLMEMMLVLAVIAMIVGITASFISTTDTKYPEANMRLNNLVTKVIGFRAMAGRLPTQTEGLEALVNKPAGFNKPWQSSLYAEDLLDPWGKPFQYRNPAKRSKAGFDLFSMGVDGTEGTNDDVGNWR